MTVHIATPVRNSMLTALATSADAGSAPATIEVRSGTQPANADAAATGTVLVTFTCADPSWEVASGGSMAIDADPDLSATAGATGTASWARMKDSNGLTVFDGSVATTGGDFTITSTSIVSGQTVTLVSGSLTLPA